MALKLEELIGKKKEVGQVLDLSRATANSSDELRRLLEKIPEFRVKPEKIKPEDVKIQDRVWRGRGRRGKRPPRGYQFSNPVPPEMQSIRLEDLCGVNIQWTMLTTLRPKSKLDEEYFSRIVELGKLRQATEEKEAKVPDSSFVRRMKNKAGILETRYLSCSECGEEFCTRETCTLFLYDNFRRTDQMETVKKTDDEEGNVKKTKRKKKKKTRVGGSKLATAKTRRQNKRKRSKGSSEGEPVTKNKKRKKRKPKRKGKKKKPRERSPPPSDD